MFDKATNIELKRINKNNIYRAVITQKKTSKQEIAYRLNLSLPTVTQNLNELMEIGLVEQEGTFQSTGGRKAKIISSNPRARAALGLDITQNHVNLVMADLEASVLNSVRKRISFRADEEYFQTLKCMINDMVKSADVPPNHILGVGVSLPALLGDDGRVLTYAPLLEGSLDLYQDLKAYIDYSYRFINDANAGGFAELCCGQIGKNALYLLLSNTVGGAIIMDGKLYRGEGGRGGEFGHMTLVPDGRPCYCGKRGCVDAYCSALLLSNVTGGDLEKFFQKLEQGDDKCREVWEEYLHYLVIVINNLQVSFDCDVVLGGYVGWHMAPYLEEIKRRVVERCNFHTDGTYLHVSHLNAEASALGAALSYIEEFIEQV
ncbi:ROK family transcriptional regulator [Muricomes intestini]|uniref:ROK family transcriptional regulator n=1 Tax=Muricomes intestini TaxID=1796634 RepID=UPI002FDD0029